MVRLGRYQQLRSEAEQERTDPRGTPLTPRGSEARGIAFEQVAKDERWEISCFHWTGSASPTHGREGLSLPRPGRIRDPPLNNLRLLVRGWRQQAVEAEVHGGGAVMVGPVAGEGDQCESPWCFAAAPDLNRIAQLGVRYFRHRSVAEVE